MKGRWIMGIALACCLALCGCGGGGGGENKELHEHSYDKTTVIAPAKGVQGCVEHSCSCGDSYRDSYIGALGEEMPTNKSYSFLFLGNSFTFVNELWNELKNVARGEGYTNVAVDQVTKATSPLDVFLDTSTIYGQAVAEKLATKSYDFVFMQDKCLAPAIDWHPVYDSVVGLHELIQEAGARDVLYMTWAKKEGSPELAENNLGYEEHFQKMAAMYEAFGEKLSIPVSPAGAAFYIVHGEHPEIELYSPDKYHPSMAGTYLAALCHYATIFGKSPVGVTYMPSAVTAEQAKILQQAAHDAVYGESLVKDEYRNEYKEISQQTNS